LLGEFKPVFSDSPLPVAFASPVSRGDFRFLLFKFLFGGAQLQFQPEKATQEKNCWGKISKVNMGKYQRKDAQITKEPKRQMFSQGTIIASTLHYLLLKTTESRNVLCQLSMSFHHSFFTEGSSEGGIEFSTM